MTSARESTARLADLLRHERHAMADFLVALADFDRKRLWLELGLSKGAAHYRKTAAELVQRFPEIIEPLRDGRLCITSIVHLAKVLTPENRHELLPRFFHRSRREAMEVAAAIRPAEAAPRREIVTAVRTPAPAAAADVKPPASPPPVEPAAVQPAELRLLGMMQGAQRPGGEARLRERAHGPVHAEADRGGTAGAGRAVTSRGGRSPRGGPPAARSRCFDAFSVRVAERIASALSESADDEMRRMMRDRAGGEGDPGRGA
jgi:hypothetical protein